MVELALEVGSRSSKFGCIKMHFAPRRSMARRLPQPLRSTSAILPVLSSTGERAAGAGAGFFTSKIMHNPLGRRLLPARSDDRTFWATTGSYPQECVIKLGSTSAISTIKTYTTNGARPDTTAGVPAARPPAGFRLADGITDRMTRSCRPSLHRPALQQCALCTLNGARDPLLPRGKPSPTGVSAAPPHPASTA